MKMSQFIHLLSIQIDTLSLELVIYHQFNNIKLSIFASRKKRSFQIVRLMEIISKSKSKIFGSNQSTKTPSNKQSDTGIWSQVMFRNNHQKSRQF